MHLFRIVSFIVGLTLPEVRLALRENVAVLFVDLGRSQNKVVERHKVAQNVSFPNLKVKFRNVSLSGQN